MTIRLSDELREWLRKTAEQTGLSQGHIIRQQLEIAKDMQKRPFMRLAGVISGPRDLSERKGFSIGKTGERRGRHGQHSE